MVNFVFQVGMLLAAKYYYTINVISNFAKSGVLPRHSDEQRSQTVLKVIWLGSLLAGILYVTLIYFFSVTKDWSKAVVVLKVYSFIPLPFFALNCYLFAVAIYKLHECRSLASNAGQLDRNSISVCFSIYLLWFLLMLSVGFKIGSFSYYEFYLRCAYFAVGLILEAVYTWILITFDLESFSLATAVVGNHLEITGLDNKGHEIFKFHINDRILRRHAHLTGLKQDVRKSDMKKKRL